MAIGEKKDSSKFNRAQNGKGSGVKLFKSRSIKSPVTHNSLTSKSLKIAASSQKLQLEPGQTINIIEEIEEHTRSRIMDRKNSLSLLQNTGIQESE